MFKQLLWGVAIGLGLLGSGHARAQAPEKTQIKIGYAGAGLAYSMVPIAQPYFKEEGLNVSMLDFNTGGTQVLQALIGGSVDVGLAFYDHTINMQSLHKDVRCVTLLTRFPAATLAVRRDLSDKIKTLADLKGRPVGVPALGATGQYMLRYWLGRAGVAPDSVSLVAVGGLATSVAAIEHKSVDAIFLNDPAATILQKRGDITLLIDGRTTEGSDKAFGGRYPSACLLATEDFIEHNPNTLQHLVNAFSRSLRWIHSHTAEELVSALPPAYVVGDHDSFVEVMKGNMEVFSPTGRIEPEDAEGFPRAYDLLAMSNPVVKATKIDFDKTYTNHFIDAAPKTP